jgi:hypothetical protein
MKRANQIDHELAAALGELDASKALMRQRRLELLNSVPASRSSSDALHTFEAKARELNAATERYLGAVGAFNAACRKSRKDSLQEIPVSEGRPAVTLRFEVKIGPSRRNSPLLTTHKGWPGGS